ncbi:hypothetical protein AAGS61_10645 [Lysinibacillus sp. KU-BSD001]|uniref:hypothetical protein n=1 Tax=Lysinibacillus sp. KU-BSD001 TaxID=3141328 RepID=UPI0036EB1475
MTMLAYKNEINEYEQIKYEFDRSNNVGNSKTAKLSQKIMFQLANGSVDISKSALQFMLYTINFVAKDGRIYSTLEEIKHALNFQNKTLVRVITELKELNLLTQKNEFLYSKFHVVVGKEKAEESYVRNLKAYTSPAVLNLNKNELRLFLYIATRGIINGVVKKSTVESLYSNVTHKGVNYIDSYFSLASALNVLISNDLIEVFIEGQVFKKSNVAAFMPTLHAYCGYQEKARKKRMSKIKKHVIGFRINPVLSQKENIRPSEAARREIEYYADQNGFFHTQMRPETIPIFIKNVQDQLFDRFGMVGVEMYRQALVTYFSTEGDNVIYHDLYADENSSKAINTMVDFFLLPSIIKVIAAAASSVPSKDEIVMYFKNKENLLALVDYFNEKASDNHLILLDEALEEVNVLLSDLVKTVPTLNPTENSWFLLQAKTLKIYKTVNYKQSLLSTEFQKRLVRQWAKEGLFTQKHLLNAVVKTLKSKVVFLPKQQFKDAMNDININTKSIKDDLKSKESIEEKKERLLEQALKITNEPIKYKF